MIDIIALSLLLLLCIILSSFFSGAEMAYMSANRIRLENMKDDGNKKAARALHIEDNFENALSAILIGNNLVNIASSSIGSVIIILIFGDAKYTWLSTLVITLIVIVFGETIPKIISSKKSTSKALNYSLSVKVLTVILSPVVYVVVFLVNLIAIPFCREKQEEQEESVEELQSIIDAAEDQGVIDEDDKEIITNAIDFAEICASEAMTARVDVQAIDIEDSFEEILDLVEKTPYSRIPVFKDSIDNIIGVLHLNKFLQALSENRNSVDIEKLLMKPCYVYKTMKLPTVLNILKKEKQHLAIVTDEYSGTLGIITMEDVLEEIVGDIWDETDVVENDVVVKNESEFILDGDLPIGEFLELVGISEDDFDAQSETVGGWVVEMLEKFPQVNDSFIFRNLEIKVTAVDIRRVEQVSVSVNAEKNSGE